MEESVAESLENTYWSIATFRNIRDEINAANKIRDRIVGLVDAIFLVRFYLLALAAKFSHKLDFRRARSPLILEKIFSSQVFSSNSASSSRLPASQEETLLRFLFRATTRRRKK